jgi:hypothetical protein
MDLHHQTLEKFDQNASHQTLAKLDQNVQGHSFFA